MLLEQVRGLHKAYREKTVWVINTEFASLLEANPVPSIILIRNLRTSKVVLQTTIDYNSIRLSDLENLINGKRASAAIPYFRTMRYLHKWYKADRTHGMSLAQVGEYLMKEAGFSPDTHCILGWEAPVDAHVFYRTLQGCTLVVDKINTDRTTFLPEGQSYFQPFNVTHLIKRCTELQNVVLEYVYRSVVQIQDLVWHEPDADTLGMVEVLKWFLTQTRSWLSQ